MNSASMLDKVVSLFKAPTRMASYNLGADAAIAQSKVDQLTLGELKSFGVTSYVEVKHSVAQPSVVYIGPFNDEVNAEPLFRRLDELLQSRRLPRRLDASASVEFAEPDSYVRSILALYGAMKAAGAELVSAFIPGADVNLIALGAVFEEGGVRLSVYAAYDFSKRGLVIPAGTVDLSAELIRSDDADVLEGYQILERGLRAILSPLVCGSESFFISPGDISLVAGVRGTVAEKYIEEASEALGIGMDGTVTLSE